MMDNEEEYIKELEQQIEDLESENESLNEDLSFCEQGAQDLESDYESLEQEYDDLHEENDELKEKIENRNMTEIIDDIHSMIGNGITSGEFKKIADMLAVKYSIKEPIAGLDYGD